MVKIIGVGDNTVDQYLHLGMMFPGGNSVNVPVFARRAGHQASYIGTFGNDRYGKLIYESLKDEEVDVSHCRIVDGPNARSQITLVDGDRVFGEHDEGVSEKIDLNQADLDFIKGHNALHTSIYSAIEKKLPTLKEYTPNLSFDFSEIWTEAYLAKFAQWVDFAFLSYPKASEQEIRDLMLGLSARGPQIIVVTLGIRGSRAFDGESFYKQSIKKVNVVDTLGAGDAFIGRFLVEYLTHQSIKDALEKATFSAADACLNNGAFGHGISID